MITYVDNIVIAPQLRFHTLPKYENLNNNQDVLQQVTNYFYKQTIEKWLYHKLNNLLLYLHIDNDKFIVVNPSTESMTKDSKQVEYEKIKFIGKYVLSKDDIKILINNISNKYNVPIYELHKQPYRKLICKKIGKLLKKKFIKNLPSKQV